MLQRAKRTMPVLACLAVISAILQGVLAALKLPAPPEPSGTGVKENAALESIARDGASPFNTDEAIYLHYRTPDTQLTRRPDGKLEGSGGHDVYVPVVSDQPHVNMGHRNYFMVGDLLTKDYTVVRDHKNSAVMVLHQIVSGVEGWCFRVGSPVYLYYRGGCPPLSYPGAERPIRERIRDWLGQAVWKPGLIKCPMISDPMTGDPAMAIRSVAPLRGLDPIRDVDESNLGGNMAIVLEEPVPGVDASRAVEVESEIPRDVLDRFAGSSTR